MRKAFTLWEFLIVVAIIAILAALLFPTINYGSYRNARRSSCQSNLKQIGLGYLQYIQDYDKKFPLTTTKQGWFGTLQPYLKSELIFQCPSEEARGKNNLTDYWFNGRLAGVEQKRVEFPDNTLLSGDGEASDDPNISLQVLPPLWSEKEDSPARRHLDTGNYGFADGHVKSLKPGAVTVEKPGQAPTFLAR